MKLELLKGSRTRILAAVILAIVAIFVVRLFYLQVVKYDYYVGLAKAEQQSRFVIPASRGIIYAKSGTAIVPMVMNETVYTVFADPATVKDKTKITDTLRQVAGGNVRADFAQLLSTPNSRYQILATKVTRTQADKIKAANLSGIGFQAVSQRVYPEGSLGAQVLGFVDTTGQGRYGVENYQNDALKGVDGYLKAVTDVNNVPLTIGNDNVSQPAVNGKNIVLSLDRNIQSYVESALAAGLQRSGAKKGSVLVMDPNNGKVLAMANLPTYDPANYGQVSDVAAFNNDTISAPYEPGSDVKTYTLATGIDKGVVKASDTYNNTDYIKVGDIIISNATLGRTGNITFQTALTWSLNTGFVTIAQRLGDGTNITKSARDIMYDYFHNRFGLGSLTGIELANEAPGTVISPDTVQGNAVRYSNMAFGQGLDATLIQVASGFSAIVNGGSFYKPTIIDGYMTDTGFKQNATPKPIRTNIIAQSTSVQVKQATRDARATSFGRTDKPGYYIGGKTGTSQVIVNGQYSNSETIGTYLGFGGSSIDTPRYVIMVQVSGKDQKLGGAQDALPIFTNISNWMLDYLKIQPKG
ncbi:MAG: penicillin-binding protein 2 [Candidatus Microsaccharimonas sossegonensis]|uniref:Penicillin-binding protein 2 n=1 Tax=Candidatus Microsaccharimonas sossegonensis TaxID=2506948 RepID=A0A4Q0AHG3_9BACT|nr:MAG: penicillin-binding protein 2 [Candidatus Microsaccharimonas sossegonensis]